MLGSCASFAVAQAFRAEAVDRSQGAIIRAKMALARPRLQRTKRANRSLHQPQEVCMTKKRDESQLSLNDQEACPLCKTMLERTWDALDAHLQAVHHQRLEGPREGSPDTER